MNDIVYAALCRQNQVDPLTYGREKMERLQRYSFLTSFTFRTDAEEAEVHDLAKEFSDCEWPISPRTFHQETT